MPLNSGGKGKAGEREVRDLLRLHGFEARRGQQFAGGGDSPDVVHDIPGLHIEVKRTERFDLYGAMEQATEDVREGSAPAVFHRRNRKPWVVVLKAGDFLHLMKGQPNVYADKPKAAVRRRKNPA